MTDPERKVCCIAVHRAISATARHCHSHCSPRLLSVYSVLRVVHLQPQRLSDSLPPLAFGRWGTTEIHAGPECRCSRNRQRDRKENTNVRCVSNPQNTRDTGLARFAHPCALSPNSAAQQPSPHRNVPLSFDARQRAEFIEISARVKAELCASFTLVSIGLQLYQNQAKIPNTDAFLDPPIP